MLARRTLNSLHERIVCTMKGATMSDPVPTVIFFDLGDTLIDSQGKRYSDASEPCRYVSGAIGKLLSSKSSAFI
jgi:hypothetical protein